MLSARDATSSGMPYKLWHSGVLIGETDFEEHGRHSRQFVGVFRPTLYGREIFPRLTGIMSAATALREELRERGLCAESMDGDDTMDLLETTAAGRKVVDIGRALSEVELRHPDGRTLEFASIAFMDVEEIRVLGRRLNVAAAPEPDALPQGAPRFMVSVTLRSKTT